MAGSVSVSQSFNPCRKWFQRRECELPLTMLGWKEVASLKSTNKEWRGAQSCFSQKPERSLAKNRRAPLLVSKMS